MLTLDVRICSANLCQVLLRGGTDKECKQIGIEVAGQCTTSASTSGFEAKVKAAGFTNTYRSKGSHHHYKGVEHHFFHRLPMDRSVAVIAVRVPTKQIRQLSSRKLNHPHHHLNSTDASHVTPKVVKLTPIRVVHRYKPIK
jgi:hypothetical protein